VGGCVLFASGGAVGNKEPTTDFWEGADTLRLCFVVTGGGMTIPSHLDTLLAEDRWARRLARALVREGEDPEDLVQEAYARSVAHLAGSGRWAPAEPRAWLGRVLRNVLAELRRARGTREQRELERARESSEQKHDARAVHVRGAGHLGHTSSDVRAGPVDCEPTPDELAARAPRCTSTSSAVTRSRGVCCRPSTTTDA